MCAKKIDGSKVNLPHGTTTEQVDKLTSQKGRIAAAHGR